MATWPNTIVLVHGYAASIDAKGHAANAAGDVNNFWYWKGLYSDNYRTYDVPGDLTNAANQAGANVQIVAANWDGVSAIETSVEYLVSVLDQYCTGSDTCDLVGHSTGDALIGYALDKYPDHNWNINTVFVAGGAGGGTEAASWQVNVGGYFNPTDPVVAQLQPQVMRALYNHDMHGNYAAVPNIRFVGTGKAWDHANGIFYEAGAYFCRGDNDGLVPFHSQGGVSDYVGNTAVQAFDSYSIRKHTGVLYSSGQLNLGNANAERWISPFTYTNISLFAGFYVAMIDNGRLYNHTDEVGRLAQWIADYKASAPGVQWTTTGIYLLHQGQMNDGQLWHSVFDGVDMIWQSDQQVANLGMSGSPSAVVYNGGLYVFHQGQGQDGQLWYTVLDGSWQPDQQVANVGMSESPSAVVYNGQLYVFHQGFAESGELWYSVFDGTNWSTDTQVPNVGMSGSPSAVAPAGGGISVFHQGANQSGELWWSYSPDGINWQQDMQVQNVGMSGSPSAVAFWNGTISVFHQGANQSGELWYSYWNGTGWEPDTQIQGTYISESPAAVAWAGGITVFHQGAGESGQLWYSFFDGTHWDPDTQVQNTYLSSSPGCIVLT